MVGKKTRDDIFTSSISPGVAGIAVYKNMSRANCLSRAIRAKNGENVRGDQENRMFVGDLLENPCLEHAVNTLGLINADLNVDYAVKHPDLEIEGSMDGIAYGGDTLEVEHDPSKGVYIMGSDRAVLSGKVVLEMKCTKDYPEVNPPLWRGVMQLQCNMDIVDAKWGVLVVLYQSTDLRMFVYHRDETMVKEIHQLALDFNRRVQEEDPYPPVNPEEALNIWERAEAEAEPIDLPEEAEELIELNMLAEKGLRKWSTIKDETSAQLMSMLQEKEIGEFWTKRNGARVMKSNGLQGIIRKEKRELFLPKKLIALGKKELISGR